jgi:oligoendopeptidase F
MPLDLSRLPRAYPRTFVPAPLDAGEWAQLAPLFDELAARPLATVAALEKWLADESELSAVIAQEGAVRYARMTCQTDDPELERAFLHFVEAIEPKAKEALNRLDEHYLASPGRKDLPPEMYRVWDRVIANRVTLFREANISLQTEDAKLAQRYQKITGAMMVNFRDQEHTLPQMARYLFQADRATRQAVWELSTRRRLQDREELDQIFDEMIVLREQIARNADFPSFRDYAFRARERFDYTPEHCFQFHAAVEQHVVPLLREIQEQRREHLELDVLRPWDLNVDPQGRPPLKPFTQAGELVEGCGAIFEKVDPQLGHEFGRMVELNLLDLDSRQGKAPGGYQQDLAEYRLPFIFMNAVGLERDVRTLLHEGGHAFNAFAAAAQPLHGYRQPPLEFAEVASMSMELLGGEFMEAFYTSAEATRSKREHLESSLTLLTGVARGDAFQHWLYTHPRHSRSEREAQWLELNQRFGGLESWEGYETARRAEWQRILHFYEVPFYYIEYGIAQLGALGVWVKARQDWRGAVEGYKRALALGGSRPLPELFEAAGLRFDFGPETVAGVVETLRAELG